MATSQLRMATWNGWILSLTPRMMTWGFQLSCNVLMQSLWAESPLETLIGFDVGWHYPIPGIILSSTMTEAPADFAQHVRFANGSPREIIRRANEQGYKNLYIDGGKTIQAFLQEDLIDELVITEIPILLGGGSPLFGQTTQQLSFELIGTEVLLEQLVKRHYRRKRD